MTPRQLRLECHIGEEYAARQAGVSRPTLRTYESCREHVKTSRCRQLLDAYYESLARYLDDNRARRAVMADDGELPGAA